jgi:hypothetical protein
MIDQNDLRKRVERVLKDASNGNTPNDQIMLDLYNDIKTRDYHISFFKRWLAEQPVESRENASYRPVGKDGRCSVNPLWCGNRMYDNTCRVDDKNCNSIEKI